ncbi:MAG: hypothetical protein ACRDOB_20770 [Streptosporangiaceae bacterium]
MRRQLRWYGASPLHLLALLACFGLAGYAAARLVPSQPLGVAAWFLGAVIGHDLLLTPLYSLADRSVMAAIRHREPQLPAGPWINYIRVPAGLSALLLLVWFPLILRLQSPYHASTTLSADPYIWHWLAITGALFLLSAVAFALRLRGRSRTAPPPERPAPAVTRPDLDGGRETGSGAPGQAATEQGHPPAALGEGEPQHGAGEVTPADSDCDRDSPEPSPGQQQRAADNPDPPSPIRDPQPAVEDPIPPSPSRDPHSAEQSDGRPDDQVPAIQPDREPG